MKIIIAAPLLSLHDAISNDVRQQCKLLKKEGFDTVIYATEARLDLKQLLINRNSLTTYLKKTENLLIYHHGVAWVHHSRPLP